MKKVSLLLSAILCLEFSAQAGTDIGSGSNPTSQCAAKAQRDVKAILALHLSKEDIKAMEIEKPVLVKKEATLSNDQIETIQVSYHYTSGEMSFDSFRTEVTMVANNNGKCMLKSYKTQF